MADLGTLRPGAANTTGLPTTGSLIDAPGASTALSDNSDSTYDAQTTNATGSYQYGRDLANTPADFGTMLTVGVQCRTAWSATPSNSTWDLVLGRVMASDGTTVLAAATSGGSFQSMGDPPETTTYGMRPLIAQAFGYVNTTADKTAWDGAILQLQWNRTRSMGGDSAAMRISEAYITGTYTPAVVATNANAGVATGTGVAQTTSRSLSLVAGRATGEVSAAASVVTVADEFDRTVATGLGGSWTKLLGDLDASVDGSKAIIPTAGDVHIEESTTLLGDEYETEFWVDGTNLQYTQERHDGETRLHGVEFAQFGGNQRRLIISEGAGGSTSYMLPNLSDLTVPMRGRIRYREQSVLVKWWVPGSESEPTTWLVMHTFANPVAPMNALRVTIEDWASDTHFIEYLRVLDAALDGATANVGGAGEAALGTGAALLPSRQLSSTIGNAAGTGAANNASATLPLTGYAGAVSDLSPSAYWRHGESAGTTMESVVGPAGTYVGSPTLGVTGVLAGDADTAINLDGSTQYGEAGDDAALDLANGPFTLAAWVKFDNATRTSYDGIIGKVGSYSLHRKPSNHGTWPSRIAFVNPNVTTICASSSPITDTDWHFVVLTYNGTNTGLIYVDGVEGTSQQTTTTLADSANAVTIGRDPDGFLDGTIDEVAIFKSVLTAQNIADLYTAALGASESANAEVATGTGAAFVTASDIKGSADASSVTGESLSATALMQKLVAAGLAESAGLASDVATSIAAAIIRATGDGAAFAPGTSASPLSQAATAVGAAGSATALVGAAGAIALLTGAANLSATSIDVHGGLPTGTSLASDATVSTEVATSVDAGVATATALAYLLSSIVDASAGLSAVSGASQDATASTASSGSADAEVATVTALAQTVAAAIATPAETTDGTVSAASAAANAGASPSVAQLSGAALLASVDIESVVELASALADAYDAIANTAGATYADAEVATMLAQAFLASTATTVEADAEAATATGAARRPAGATAINPHAAEADATAYDLASLVYPRAGAATATGASLAAAPSIGSVAELAEILVLALNVMGPLPRIAGATLRGSSTALGRYLSSARQVSGLSARDPRRVRSSAPTQTLR